MAEAAFWPLVAGLLLLDGSVALSIAKPACRIWPPPRRFSWQYFFTWGLFYLGVVGIVALGVLDGNSLQLGRWTRFLAGAGPMLLGAAFGSWGVIALGAHASEGLGGALVTRGPYRYSRNPQYVGNVALVFGYAVLCGSRPTLVAAFVLAVWFVLAPFAEEPWLRDRLGASYERYLGRAPRFLAFPAWRRRSAT